ncbi:response regulator transcription factor [Ureibacillus manganicus]|uniref:PhoP family transcriptional regulator n=1 Tax=Ureibacillus manganicus DSM 26584 TaxID=1384049 RepID=A0A0A3I0U3_9BACL|nr:response regulator transcription factor [Ureibacillus manganicus]KGR77125.1 PhoP family transcriptional regulator [Ureibacillus manganicus DSM 26584]
MKKNILIVDDQPEIAELLSLYLEKVGFNIIQAKDGMDALMHISKGSIDLMLVDLMMPIIDGYQLIKKVRESMHIPIIIISAKQENQDKIFGLEIGADDYIQKPFDPLEVVARVQALMRRSYNFSSIENSNSIEPETVKKVVGDLTLDEATFSIIRNGHVIQLTKIEYKILNLLMSTPGRVYTKQQIFENAWDDYYIGGEEDNTINVHISKIREKIEVNPKKPLYIKTVRGLGYKFEKQNSKV